MTTPPFKGETQGSRQITTSPQSTGSIQRQDVTVASKKDDSRDQVDYVALAGFNKFSVGENVLGRYHNPTYHFRLFMANEDDTNQITEPYKEFFNKLEKNNKIITIAESGATGYSIDSVSIDTIINDRNSSSLSFFMEITEPRGASMVEKMMLSATRLGVKSWMTAPFYLELYFLGYNHETGLPERINTGHKIWSITLTDIKANVSEGATSYSLMFIPYSNMAKAPEYSQIKKPMTINADTIGDFFDIFSIELETGAETAIEKFILHNTYKFVFSDPEMRKWPIVQPEDGPYKPQNSKSWVKERAGVGTGGGQDSNTTTKTTIHLGAGTSIYDAIAMVFASTKQGQEKLGIIKKHQKKISGNQKTEDITTDPTKNTFQMVKTQSDIVRGDFNDYAGDYDKNFIFYIDLFDISRVIVDMNQIDAKASDTEAIKRLESLGRRLNRRYDFYYTGLNNDIINFDVRMNSLYVNSLSIMGGAYTSSLTQDGYFLDKRVEELRNGIRPKIDEHHTKIKNLKIELLAHEHYLRNKNGFSEKQIKNDEYYRGLQEKIAVERKALDTTVSEYNESVNRVPTSSDSSGQSTTEKMAMDRKRESASKRLAQFRDSNSKTRYAEDLTGDLLDIINSIRLQNPNQALKPRVGEDTNESEADFMTGIETRYDRGRNLMGAILNNIYAADADFMNIQLEIRGDPYWVGLDDFEIAEYRANRTNRERTDTNTPPSNTSVHVHNGSPNFYESEHCFLLSFVTPVEYNETTGIATPDHGSMFEGIYFVLEVKNEFSGGMFTQTLNAVRDLQTPSTLIEKLKERKKLTDSLNGESN